MPFEESAQLLKNEQLGPRLYLMQLASPQIADCILPGQFVHLLLPEAREHILRRPFSVFDVNTSVGTLDILYQTVGKGTEYLSRLESDSCAPVSLIGPVGHGWELPQASARRALLVGGGVGAAPLFMLYKALCAKGVSTELVLGAATKDALVCRAYYETFCKTLTHAPSHEIFYATDDGSYGYAGFCTPLAESRLQKAAQSGFPFDIVYTCGPLPLMKGVAQGAQKAHVACQVSLEERMACGIGACLSCVVNTGGGKKRVCVDGPVFYAEEVF